LSLSLSVASIIQHKSLAISINSRRHKTSIGREGGGERPKRRAIKGGGGAMQWLTLQSNVTGICLCMCMMADGHGL
jgi:hypothetical protein